MTNAWANDMEEIPFILHMYRKQELAMLYFPNVSKEAASRNLRRWIGHCHPLKEGLEAMGYDKNRKVFFREEVRLIVSYLGEP